MASLLAAILPRFGESVSRYVTPFSRGLEPDLIDSVVLLNGQRVDLAPALAELGSGTLRVHLESLTQERGTGKIPVEWQGRGPAAISVGELGPGLYRLIRFTADDKVAGTPAWVLVSPPDRFNGDSAKFASAVEAVKKWPDEVDPRAPRAVLRAFLESLSEDALAGKENHHGLR